MRPQGFGGGQHSLVTRELPSIPDSLKRADILLEALTSLRDYAGETVVVMYGGQAMTDDRVAAGFGRDIVLLKHAGINPVVVHGGGAQINTMLSRLSMDAVFADWHDDTSVDSHAVATMVLAGVTNKDIAAIITQAGSEAIGICGSDGRFISVASITSSSHPVRHPDLIEDEGVLHAGLRFKARVMQSLINAGFIPVIAPIAVGELGRSFVVSADVVASGVAVALGAKRLLFLTDIAGVRDGDDRLIPELSISEAISGIADGIIKQGMKPKVESCITALHGGVEAAVIVDGRIAHACVFELLQDQGAGTLIRHRYASHVCDADRSRS